MLDEGSVIICRAYSELSSCRAVGMTIGPIPWLAMLEWCRYHRLDRDVANHLIRILRIADAETLRRLREKK